MSLAPYILAAVLQVTAADAPTIQAKIDALSAAAANCEVPGAYFVQFTDEPRRVRILVPKELWSKRKEASIAVKLHCLNAVVVGRGYKPILLGMRR